MWIIYQGKTLKSAWDKEESALRMKRRMEALGYKDLYVKFAGEFQGCFNNGYLF